MMLPIDSRWFYASEGDKTKINWFCYELALEYHDAITAKGALDEFRSQHGKKDIARFCTHFSLSMKKSLSGRLAKKAGGAIISEKYITQYYPQSTARQTALLLDAAARALESLLSNCECCPLRCISDAASPCDFFDYYEDEPCI